MIGLRLSSNFTDQVFRFLYRLLVSSVLREKYFAELQAIIEGDGWQYLAKRHYKSVYKRIRLTNRRRHLAGVGQ